MKRVILITGDWQERTLAPTGDGISLGAVKNTVEQVALSSCQWSHCEYNLQTDSLWNQNQTATQVEK